MKSIIIINIFLLVLLQAILSIGFVSWYSKIIDDGESTPKEELVVFNNANTNDAAVPANNNNITKLQQLTTNTTRKKRIWINVLSYNEGISAWRLSIIELLQLADIMNATLVEPCVKEGRLMQCSSSSSNSTHHAASLGTMFDLSSYMQNHQMMVDTRTRRRSPLMASYDEYQRYLNSIDSDEPSKQMYRYSICTGGVRDNKINNCGDTIRPWLINTTAFRTDISLQKLAKNEQQQTQTIVIELNHYWHKSSHKVFDVLLLSEEDLAERRKVLGPSRISQDERLQFHTHHIQMIKNALEQKANITNASGFTIIHWRAEAKHTINYMKCANSIVKVKDTMMKKIVRSSSSSNIDNINNTLSNSATAADGQHKFVLMTSLNQDLSKMWSGSRNKVKEAAALSSDNNTANKALDFLINEHYFIKIDNLVDISTDDNINTTTTTTTDAVTLLAIYDLILSTLATNFATCSRGYSKVGCNEETRALCEECNHIGKFGRFAIELRNEKVSSFSR